jgi:cyclophilin family peptidyl-prolyl cis-trans isomerase/uncharacterized protein with beta-barrel porin domain
MNRFKRLFSKTLTAAKNRAPRLHIARRALAAAAFALAAFAPTAPQAEAATIYDTVRLTVSVGGQNATVDIRLLPAAAPLTVENFLRYVNASGTGTTPGASGYSPNYIGSFLHRSVPGFVVQGGGYRYVSSTGDWIDVGDYGTVLNEYGLHNIRGTLAMAKLGGDPNSASSEWFVNIGDNRPNLDSQNGGFTVFADVVSADGLSLFDDINSTTESDDVPTYATTDGNYLFVITGTELIGRDQSVNDRVHQWTNASSTGIWDTVSDNWQIVGGNGVTRPFPQQVEALFAPVDGATQNISVSATASTPILVTDLRFDGAGTAVITGGAITGRKLTYTYRGETYEEGRGALVKNGTGTLTFKSTQLDFEGGIALGAGVLEIEGSTFTGPAAVNAGSLRLDNSTLVGSVTIANGAALALANNAVINAGSGTVTNSGTISGNGAVNADTFTNVGTLSPGAATGEAGRIKVGGGLANNGTVRLELNAAGIRDVLENTGTANIAVGGTVVLGVETAWFTTNGLTLDLGDFLENTGSGSIAFDNTAIFDSSNARYEIDSVDKTNWQVVFARVVPPLTWAAGTSGDWDTSSSNWRADGETVPSVFEATAKVTFDIPENGNYSINVHTGLQVSALTITGAGNIVFQSGSVLGTPSPTLKGGAGTFAKNGTGTATFNATQLDFTGNVSINVGQVVLDGGAKLATAATIEVKQSATLALRTGAVVEAPNLVSEGYIIGSGTIRVGTFTNHIAGIFSPGETLGTAGEITIEGNFINNGALRLDYDGTNRDKLINAGVSGISIGGRVVLNVAPTWLEANGLTVNLNDFLENTGTGSIAFSAAAENIISDNPRYPVDTARVNIATGDVYFKHVSLDLTWKGDASGSGVWDLTTKNWGVRGNETQNLQSFEQGDKVTFTAETGQTLQVAVGGDREVADLDINGFGEVNFSGGSVTGKVTADSPTGSTGTLTKDGEGSAKFTGTTLDFEGGANFKKGTFELANSTLTTAGNVAVADGTTLTLSSGATLTTAGTATNSGTVNSVGAITVGGGDFTNSGTILSTGSLTVSSGSLVNNNTVFASGSISVASAFTNNGLFSPGAAEGAVGRLTFNGAFANNGTLRLDVDAVGARDVIVNAGAANITIGGRLLLALDAAFLNANATLDLATLLENTGSGSITFADWLLNYDPALDTASPKLVDILSDVNYVVTDVSGGVVSFEKARPDAASLGGFAGLTSLQLGVSTEVTANVRSRLASWRDFRAAQRPDPVRIAEGTAVAGSSYESGVTVELLDPVPKNGTAYLTGFGNFIQNGSGSDSPAFDTNFGGALVGVDFPLGDSILAGVGLAAANGRASLHDHRGSVRVSDVRVAAYATWAPLDWLWLEGSVHGGVSNLESARRVNEGTGWRTFSGDTDGFVAGAAFYVGGRFEPLKAFVVSPFIGLEYTHAEAQGFSEKIDKRGESPARLHVNWMGQDSLLGRVGSSFAWRASNDISLRLTAAYVHELCDSDVTAEVRFIGAGKTTTDLRSTFERRVEVGPSIDYTLNSQISFGLGYTFASDLEDQTAHRVQASFILRF